MIMCLAFVDDTDLVHATTDPSKSTKTLIQEAQHALSLWEGLIRATGGALAPKKAIGTSLMCNTETVNGSCQQQTMTRTPFTSTMDTVCNAFPTQLAKKL